MVKLIPVGHTIALAVFMSAPVLAEERPSLAVFPTIAVDVVRDQFAASKLDAQELTRQIEESIRATRRFSLFERSGEILRGSVLLEQDFARAGQALHNAAEAGKLNNVQFIAQPLVTGVNVTIRRYQQEERPGQYRYNATGSLTVTTKILDTTSGEIMYQATRDVELPVPNALASGFTGPADDPLAKAAAWRALATAEAGKISNAVVGSLFPIQVMTVQGGDIFVNRGEGAGIATGEHFQIFSIGAPLIDPATKEKIGDAEELLGDVEIVRTTPRFSVAHEKAPLHGEVKGGDVLRPVP